MPELPPLRYLAAADVLAALPDVATRLQLAERTLVALVEDAELPPKIGVHPREAGSFGHAMPALLRGPREDGTADLLGMKWVVAFPSNAESGLPAIHGTTLMSDARTGVPRAFLDAGVLTAHRTAAMSGVAIGRWGPRGAGRTQVALIGAGAQARHHLPVIAHLLPGATVLVHDREAGRAEALCRDVATGALTADGLAAVDPASDPLAAVSEADVVLTMVSFGPRHQVLPADAFAPHATIVAIDYDMCVPSQVARQAALFLVDHREQYRANHSAEVFVGYPWDATMMGEAILGGRSRPDGRVLVCHLGVGLADLVFADAVLRAAEAQGIGTILAR
jgi:ornithine cyclodeaminase/alanine dehydrogenase-like protein (mu-crystallin family)